LHQRHKAAAPQLAVKFVILFLVPNSFPILTPSLGFVTYDKPASISRGQQVYAKKSTKRIQAWDKNSLMNNNNIVKSKASDFLE